MCFNFKQKIDTDPYEMGWIRNFKIIDSIDKRRIYSVVYEVASEARLTGHFSYKKGEMEVIGLSILSYQRDRNGLYHYALRLPFFTFPDYYEDAVSSDGYYFPSGDGGELISLFSVFLQARFYLVARYDDVKNGCIGQKLEYGEDFSKKEFNYKSFYPMFRDDIDDKKNLNGLNDFLDSIRLMNSKDHQSFVLACSHYLKGLKEIGINVEDEELSYIRLVSAIEVLAERMNVDDPLDNKDFSLFEVIDNPEVVKRLYEVLNVDKHGKTHIKKPTLKFILFIEKYSKGFFVGEKYNEGNPAADYIIFEKDLKMHLENIYSARSSYLHAGKPMFLSRYYDVDFNADIDPVYGEGRDMMKIEFRKVGKGKIKYLLPHLNWFESLVRYCLLEYLKDKSRENN